MSQRTWVSIESEGGVESLRTAGVPKEKGTEEEGEINCKAKCVGFFLISTFKLKIGFHYLVFFMFIFFDNVCLAQSPSVLQNQTLKLLFHCFHIFIFYAPSIHCHLALAFTLKVINNLHILNSMYIFLKSYILSTT